MKLLRIVIATIATLGATLALKEEKPRNKKEAFKMIRSFSNGIHTVFTSVTFTRKNFQKTINDSTKVWFNKLTDEEINYYNNFFSCFFYSPIINFVLLQSYMVIDSV
mgnify:CR=1 FL=1